MRNSSPTHIQHIRQHIIQTPQHISKRVSTTHVDEIFLLNISACLNIYWCRAQDDNIDNVTKERKKGNKEQRTRKQETKKGRRRHGGGNGREAPLDTMTCCSGDPIALAELAAEESEKKPATDVSPNPFPT